MSRKERREVSASQRSCPVDDSRRKVERTSLTAPQALSDIYVRASVVPICNMNCVYCPKASGMENRVPPHLTGRHLSTDEYIRALGTVAAAGVTKISFTGGEPTLNRDLPKIVRAARELFEVVEITSNGKMLLKYIDELADMVDVLKISLDSMNPELFSRLTNVPPQEHSRVLAAVEASAQAFPRVAINCVYSDLTRDELPALIDYASGLNARASAEIYLSVLDFYYSADRREEWIAHYLPIAGLERQLHQSYPMHEEVDRFGCRFVWFDAKGLSIRLKDSASGTMRSGVCSNCKYYCQEGLYGLKLSSVGWITPCPVNDTAFGSEVSNWSPDDEMVRHLLASDLDASSFERMLVIHNLALGGRG